MKMEKSGRQIVEPKIKKKKRETNVSRALVRAGLAVYR